MTQPRRGAFIVIEGLDRSGKTSQSKLLAQRLTESGKQAQYISFPDRTTVLGKQVDNYLRKITPLDDVEIHTLFSQNRFELKEKVINLLHSGITLIVDRYSYSGAAFTAAKGKEGLDLKWCFDHEIGLPAPDAVIFMHVSPHIAATRGGYGDEIYETSEFQKRARSQFDQIISISPSWDEALLKYHTMKDTTDEKCDSNDVNVDVPTKQDCYIAPWITVNADNDYETVQDDLFNVVAPIISLVSHSPLYSFNANPFEHYHNNIINHDNISHDNQNNEDHQPSSTLA